eukprot:972614-Amphidinium_carterae.2
MVHSEHASSPTAGSRHIAAAGLVPNANHWLSWGCTVLSHGCFPSCLPSHPEEGMMPFLTKFLRLHASRSQPPQVCDCPRMIMQASSFLQFCAQ